MKKLILNLIYVALLLLLAGCSFVSKDADVSYYEAPHDELPFDSNNEEPFDIEAPDSDDIRPEDVEDATDSESQADYGLDDNEDPAIIDDIPEQDSGDLNESPIEKPIIEAHNVRFYVANQLTYVITVDTYELVIKPENPIKENHQFKGWFTTDDNLFDFNQEILEDTNLYAVFELDYALIVNLLATTYMSTNVEITARHWNTGFPKGAEIDVVGGLGSGVIFSIQENTYYVLTNNHVVYGYDRTNHEYMIKDYKGNIYVASLYALSDKPAYDLAILYFTKQDEDLRVSTLSNSNPVINDTVISLGSPFGQDNTFTIGEVKSYTYITLSDANIDSSSVRFEVIRHSAPIASGSSGGVILNTSFEIVGINFAGPKDGTFDLSAYGYAIPLTNTLEYLEIYFKEPITNS